jgi:hypothetical protein
MRGGHESCGVLEMWVLRYSSFQKTRAVGMDTQTFLHRSVAMHVLRQPVLPATFRKHFVYVPGVSEALAFVDDVPVRINGAP